jgi:ArsR family transcriptional regulator, arsenate/arsenite/antimonite-responsive transcriptional repressor
VSLNVTFLRWFATIVSSAGDGVDSSAAAAALAALGHGLRLEVWRLLVPYGPRGLSAGVIAARLEVAPSSLSFHLQQMTHGRILVQQRSSRQIIYAINDEVMKALVNFLGGGELVQRSPVGLAVGQPGDVLRER